MIIPSEIIRNYKEVKAGDEMPIAVRAMTNIDNKLGESYLLGDHKSLIVYTGKIGQKKTSIHIEYCKIQNINIEEKKPFAFLLLTTDTHNMKLKFGIYDLHLLKKLLKTYSESTNITQATESTQQVPAESEHASDSENISCTPMIAFSAMLHAMVYIDNEAAAEELKMLDLTLGKKNIIEDGLALWKLAGTAELVKLLADRFSDEQNQCLIANLIETAMIDGLLKSEESEFLDYLCSELGVSDENFKYLFNALLIKNNLTVF